MTTPRPRRFTFRGQIAGAGSTSGVRVVVGRWLDSHLGAFADVMVETPQGHRVLLAPSPEVAEFICDTYEFDEVRIGAVEVVVDGEGWRVRGPGLDASLATAGRTLLGRLLRLVPRGVAASPVWATVVDPVARLVLRGVRTRGTALEGRREFYGATDLHAVTRLSGTFDDAALGDLAPVEPPCRFGFSSTPRTPGVTDVVTTVVLRRPRR